MVPEHLKNATVPHHGNRCAVEHDNVNMIAAPAEKQTEGHGIELPVRIKTVNTKLFLLLNPQRDMYQYGVTKSY